MIVRTDAGDYLNKHPSAEDVYCVIEVSDSSLQYDCRAKAMVYAGGNIPVYLIINIPERRIEIFSQPDSLRGVYVQSEYLQRDKTLHLPVSGNRTIAIPTEQLIPAI